MSYRHRIIEDSVCQLVGVAAVIMVTGPRQAGKSTLLQYLATQSARPIDYITLDDMKLRTAALDDPAAFIENLRTPVIIDEFQYAPDLLHYIKIAVDDARRNEMFGAGKPVGTMFYLTGSQIFQTMRTVSESLAGRVSLLNLYPYSEREVSNVSGVGFDGGAVAGDNPVQYMPFVPDLEQLYIRPMVARRSPARLAQAILRGKYPFLHSHPTYRTEQYYSDYMQTYIERDIRKIVNLKDEYKFMKFINALAVRTGQEFIAEHLARDADVNSATATEWLSLVKSTGLVYLLPQFAKNDLARAAKRPKVYFMDTGLACYLAGYTDVDTLMASRYYGAIFETYAVSEVVKSFTNTGRDVRNCLFYYRDRAKREIDLIIVDNHQIFPVEIKSASMPAVDAGKHFGVLGELGLDCQPGIVLCQCSEITKLGEGVYAVPVGCI